MLGQFGAAIGLTLGHPTSVDGSPSWNVLVAGLWLVLVAFVASLSAGFSAIASAMIVGSGPVNEAAGETIARLVSNSSVIFAFATAAGAALAAATAWSAGTIGRAHRDAGLSIHETVPTAFRKRA